LESVLKIALQTATWHKGQVYLALFAGTDPVGEVIKKKGGAVVRFEYKQDPRYDLTKAEVQQTIRRWIVAGIAWAVFLGTHCQTWSLASYSKGKGSISSSEQTFTPNQN
jgi:hypothetical protein